MQGDHVGAASGASEPPPLPPPDVPPGDGATLPNPLPPDSAPLPLPGIHSMNPVVADDQRVQEIGHTCVTENVAEQTAGSTAAEVGGEEQNRSEDKIPEVATKKEQVERAIQQPQERDAHAHTRDDSLNEKECETKTQKLVVKTELVQKTQKQEFATKQEAVRQKQVKSEQFQVQAEQPCKKVKVDPSAKVDSGKKGEASPPKPSAAKQVKHEAPTQREQAPPAPDAPSTGQLGF